MANGMLLNKTELKKFIKQRSQEIRPHSPFERVSDETVQFINGYLRAKLVKAIQTHCSMKTFTDFQP